jgi:hypothetical protein
MTRMNLMNALDARRAKIEVRAVEAFVTNSKNGVVTAITGSKVDLADSRKGFYLLTFVYVLKFVSGMVAMLRSMMTR